MLALGKFLEHLRSLKNQHGSWITESDWHCRVDQSYKLGGEGKEIEADETWIGGKAKNMHAKRRAMFKTARESATYVGDTNYVNKTTVWGVLDREQRKVRATIVPKVNRESLQAAVMNQVEHGSMIFTDQAKVYSSLPKE